MEYILTPQILYIKIKKQIPLNDYLKSSKDICLYTKNS